MSPPLPPKREVALALLERSSVHVHLDPRLANVVVPPVFKNQPQLVLQIGLNMPVPIPDLRLDEDGMSCTLSFNRSPFHCVIPWPSIFAMVGEDGRGMVWPDDLPPEVARQAAAARRATPTPVSAGDEKARERDDAGDEALGKNKKAAKRRPRPEPAVSSAAGKGSPSIADEARARLVAVPAAPPSDGGGEPRTPRAPSPSPAATPSPAPRIGRAPGEAPSPAAARPRPSNPGAGRPSRPKRELPPYLRVVK